MHRIIDLIDRSKFKTINKFTEFDDPTYLGFFLMFQSTSPLFYNASEYLKKIGEYNRAEKLDFFIKKLTEINNGSQWYWQSLEGLDSAWKLPHSENPYFGTDDAKITINTLENIELKITQLLAIYREIIYDINYRREIIPENLRKFNLYIWVQDIRKFKYNTRTQTKLIDSITDKDITEDLFTPTPWLLFKLEFCEFDTIESNNFLGSISYSESIPATNAFSIKYENIKYEFGETYYKFFSKILKNNDPSIELGSNNYGAGKTFVNELNDKLNAYTTDLKSGVQNLGNAFESQITQSAENIAEGFIGNALMGNVYGISPSGTIAAINQASLSSVTGNIRESIPQSEPILNLGPSIYNNIERSTESLKGDESVYDN